MVVLKIPTAKALEYLGWYEDDKRNTNGTSVSPQIHQKVEVHLVITDYFMPGMTGYDLLKKIKVYFINEKELKERRKNRQRNDKLHSTGAKLAIGCKARRQYFRIWKVGDSN
ncbi:two-component response regulator ARR8-like [Olea europaea subsp. europaea]|uniref:Two-component response regulator ARR8-like n=1 Tax=Olea europaea subsp. europaea TaxID=158383 RepID=A0A8S0RF59_OLEEU|nr:two-component response regulator ARR8-like [Olea europaea subsp. europaea]